MKKRNKPEDLFDLTGRVALITGAAGLLGGQHAIALLEKNASVILTDISEERLTNLLVSLKNEYPSANIQSFEMDVTNQDSIQSVQSSLLERELHVDILINNAAIDPKVKKSGLANDSSRFEHFSIDRWELELSVGLKGAFLCSQCFGTSMANDGGGVVLNIASDLSVIAPDQRLYLRDDLKKHEQPVKPVTYSVIKPALVGMTRYLAAYWAEDDVRVNAISPGGVFVEQDDEFVKKLCELIPLRRMAQKDEYHGAIQFLCSTASSYLTGHNLVMDGGRSII